MRWSFWTVLPETRASFRSTRALHLWMVAQKKMGFVPRRDEVDKSNRLQRKQIPQGYLKCCLVYEKESFRTLFYLMWVLFLFFVFIVMHIIYKIKNVHAFLLYAQNIISIAVPILK